MVRVPAGLNLRAGEKVLGMITLGNGKPCEEKFSRERGLKVA